MSHFYKISATFSLISSLLFLENVWYQIIAVSLAIVVAISTYLDYVHTTWDRAGIPSIPASFPFGAMNDVVFQRASFAEVVADLYKRTGIKKYVGIYSFFKPQIFIKDLDLVKTVLIKDFSNFVDRGIYVNTKHDPLTGNLFSLEGQRWKDLRAKISPSFTSGKLKGMFPTVRNVAKDLSDYTSKTNLTSNTINIKDLTGRYGLEVISSVALGIEGNNFKETDTEMRRMTQEVTAPSGMELFRGMYHLFCRGIANYIPVKSVPQKVEDFFFQITENTIRYRKENNVKRNDFLQLLMALEEDGTHKENKGQISLTLSEMAAQSFVFVIAGYETTSVTLCFLLYELALQQDLQQKLIEELDSIEPDSPYEELMKLPYLEMVINETLRKHPPVPFLQRECAKDYTMPDGKLVKAGTVCMIPVFAMHRDPELFPDPETFDPERFNKENIKNIKPYSYLPFGEGPRICIGNRFAMMQLKLALASLFSRFRVTLSDRTPVPIKIERKTFVYNSEGGVWVHLISRHTDETKKI